MDIETIPLGDRTLTKVFDRLLATSPDGTALRDAEGQLTVEQAWRKALSFARAVEKHGLGWQEPAALMLDNHVDNVLCWLGLALTGRPEVSINTAYKGEMLRHVLRDSGVRLVVVEEAYLDAVLEVAAGAPGLEAIIVRTSPRAAGEGERPSRRSRLVTQETLEAAWAEPATAPADIRPWDLISISYTSGTTGRSKGVLCPHGHAFGHASAEGLGRTHPGETRFVTLPQFHIAGRWGGVYNALMQGGCAFVADRFRASSFWRDAKAVDARSSQLVGTMAEFLKLQPQRLEDRDHGVREICMTPLPRDPKAWAARFGVHLTTCFGSTEIGAVIETIAPAETSSGRARPGYEIRLVNEHDCEVEQGSTGELVVRPLLPWTSGLGYLNRPEQSAEVWRNGWLHSGDALLLDTAGNFHFVDRLDDALRRRGENISSLEVEHLISDQDCVREVAVVGIPSEYLEEDLLAVIVCEGASSVTELELAGRLARTLPDFMVPRYIRFIDELPKTATGKVVKKALKAAGTTGAWDAQAEGFVAKLAGAAGRRQPA